MTTVSCRAWQGSVHHGAHRQPNAIPSDWGAGGAGTRSTPMTCDAPGMRFREGPVSHEDHIQRSLGADSCDGCPPLCPRFRLFRADGSRSSSTAITADRAVRVEFVRFLAVNHILRAWSGSRRSPVRIRAPRLNSRDLGESMLGNSAQTSRDASTAARQLDPGERPG